MADQPMAETLPLDDPASPQSEAPPVAPEKGNRGRWPKRIAVAGVLVGGAGLLAGPSIAGSWLRGEIERQAAERINGTVTLEDVSLGLNGKGTLTGLVVLDETGRRVVSVPEARVDIGLRSLLTGKKDISAVISDVEIELAQAADGTWNIEGLMKPSVEDDEEGHSDDGDEPVSIPGLDLHGRVEIANAKITLQSQETALVLRDVHMGAGLDGKKRGLTIEATGALDQDQESVGAFKLKAVLWPKAGDGAELGELSIIGLDLAAVQDALLLVGAPLEDGAELGGLLTFEASGTLADLHPDTPFSLRATSSIEGLHLDLRSDGGELLTWDDQHATASVQAERTELAGPPKATMALSGRGDKLKADVQWDGAADVGLTAEVIVDALSASAGLEPLLARVHPVFASAQAIDGAAIDASVTSTIELTYAAPLPLDLLQQGWATLPKEPLHATGHLALDEGLVEASPFFRQVLQAFDLDADPAFQMKPLGFALEGDRLNYTNPWTWTIQGTETNFVGSVGLAGDLDLRWVVPVTGGLAQQNRIFQIIEGETFEVALGGTMTAPSFNVVGALTGLAQRVAKQELQERVQKEFQEQKERLLRELQEQKQRLAEGLNKELDKGLKEVTGGLKGDAAKAVDEVLSGKVPVKSVGDAAKKILAGGQGAADLLKQADQLWAQGKRAEAAVIYQRISKEFSLSTTYLFNKKRIKKRRKG